jgi:hypothetical protein
MSKALGDSPETEHRLGLHEIAQVLTHLSFLISQVFDFAQSHAPNKRLKGQTGLFFTSYDPAKTEEWFDDFKAPDYARAGNVATQDVVLPVGVWYRFFTHHLFFPLSMLSLIHLRPNPPTDRPARTVPSQHGSPATQTGTRDLVSSWRADVDLGARRV